MDSTADKPLETARPPVPPQLSRFCFSSVNAAEMQRKAIQARRASKIIQPVAPIEAQPQSADSAFLIQKRNVIRARMERIEDMLDIEEDASKLDRLASAWSKLAEQERILDGRPLPGSFKPTGIKPRVNPITSSLPE